jgi:hypothetical protein
LGFSVGSDYKPFDKNRTIEAEINRAGFDFCISQLGNLGKGYFAERSTGKDKEKP